MKSHPALRQHDRAGVTTRRALLGGILAIVTVTGLAGCGLSPASNAESPTTLTVATWKGYGADLPWVVEEFKKETGATVRFQYIDSEQSELQLVQKSNGAIDVALPNLQYLRPGVQQGLFAPLDTAKLTNYKDIYPALSGRSELRAGGKLYAMPWVWGSSGLFYDARSVKTAPTSWNALWDKAYQDKVAVFDDPTILAPIAGLHLGEDPNDPNLAKVQPALKALAANCKLVFSSSDDAAKAISNGSVTLGVADAGTVGSFNASKVGDVRFVMPKEGAMGWLDNWAIVAKSKHRDLAYKWLNFITSPAYLAKWANDPAAAAPTPANSVAVSMLTPETRKRLQTDPSKLDTLHLQVPLPASRLQGWSDAWQQAKAG